jgi:hypothetical protein
MNERGAGWIWFAAIVLIMAGVMRFFDSLWAFSYHGTLPSNFEGAIFGHTLKTYGWVYLAVAIILVLSGLGVLVRSQAARWIGVIAAVIGAVSSIWWMPYYPIWALTYIVLGALVIYALVAYGDQEAT